MCCLPSGAVLSGGMDGCLWLWPPGSSGSSGFNIPAAHGGPVSKVACLTAATAVGTSSSTRGRGAAGSSSSSTGCRQEKVLPAAETGKGPCLAVSCSYDKTVKVWEVGPDRAARARGGRAAAAAARQVAVLAGHDSPVLEMAVQPVTTGCASSSSSEGSSGSGSSSTVILTGEGDWWLSGVGGVLVAAASAVMEASHIPGGVSK